MKVLGAFIGVTVFLYAGVNWFARPLIPMIAEIVPSLTLWHCAGASGLLMIAALVFGSGK